MFVCVNVQRVNVQILTLFLVMSRKTVTAKKNNTNKIGEKVCTTVLYIHLKQKHMYHTRIAEISSVQSRQEVQAHKAQQVSKLQASAGR